VKPAQGSRRLWIVILLAGCHVSQVTPPAAKTPSSSAPKRPATSVASSRLVNNQTAVGHRDFANAKKVLPKIFAGMEDDFYCGCHYVGHVVQLASCGYQPRKNPTRAARIEWEHVVPAWVLGHQRQCWQQGGRKHCTDTDAVFQRAEGDLNNLVPAVGEVNGDRSNFAYSAWTRQATTMYGACQTVVDFKMQRVEEWPSGADHATCTRLTTCTY
jgi:deoxyribonuclease-1